jgi:hypothetical protein
MIFSPRKIMFQYQLAIWECNNGSWHESSLCTIPTALEASYFKPTTSPWQSQIEISCWPDVQQYISIVHDYARRKLTYGDDALHAITSLLHFPVDLLLAYPRCSLMRLFFGSQANPCNEDGLLKDNYPFLAGLG